ncbi:MAG: hypothetical protein UX85_C0001G0153 [Candidatus Beckwithbacteria bacterium GW2011_GWB1_47_15]|uniref:Uncharacterized protein n=1 Tax=Candidatus Beckwithbacteria bacterium GW2011_GWB1_47_15 TaxID=1618371 RepID=A0A0G1RX84_9BACT|nr:MAG: hypothetical protein UY43_C0001G0973 [Candidatus Beckwithbacteria bacterium GW2011_GWC1_49_16]AQS30790.1 hypothetical protein [uncultured bacterium]KKU35975.1 MAG: hypothetical protein UX50_C0001G0152 [Candidatus Beckwithbacteria bacterium GW2011_GWA1_46_30]KKU61939.1 MAG: hypothetical protein UX85_C0001G0153 [Candidatus Beckwithbacteria bacterium GW2011_GWB1_47_15]KKU72507.1 MAG: hypothetical protein UX97_C0001G0377 [Candidatus Beckwithbacteria bacterium GW2011_GWA2_47_25]KKW04326.1 M
MKYQHRDLAKGKWRKLTLMEQMANVGSEVSRTIKWKKKDKKYAQMAFWRALELLGLTINDPKNKAGLKEICRAKEMLVDWYFDNPLYRSSDEEWQRYFNQFNWAARIKR